MEFSQNKVPVMEESIQMIKDNAERKKKMTRRLKTIREMKGNRCGRQIATIIHTYNLLHKNKTITNNTEINNYKRSSAPNNGRTKSIHPKGQEISGN